MGTDTPTTHRKRWGFSLIEAAIVLAVVGAVIGGIWSAAASVMFNWNINETAQGIVLIADGARKLFPRANYPASSYLHVEHVLFVTNIIPPNYKYIGGGANGRIESPAGLNHFIYLDCQADMWRRCPSIWMEVAWNFNHPGNGNRLTTAECTQLVRKVATYSRAGDGLYLIQVGRPGNSGQYMLTPPFDVSNFTCPSSISAQWFLNFYWEP